MKEELIKKVHDAILSGEPEVVKQLVEEAIRFEISPIEIIEKGLTAALHEIGNKFERGEAFLPDLIMSAEAVKEGFKILESRILKDVKRETKGKIIIGTVKGDVHDIGKNIVATLLKAEGFDVYDLGVDVPTEVFIEKTREIKPDVIGLSALMTVTLPEQRKVIEALKEAKLRENVKVIVGGAPVNEEWAKEIGADGYADNAIDGVKLIKKMILQI